jgi:hypothetical protein
VGKAARRKIERRASKMSKVTLSIVIEEDGRIGVNGPIQDKILCYGLLEVGRQAIQAYNPEQRIVTPEGKVPTNLKLVS